MKRNFKELSYSQLDTRLTETRNAHRKARMNLYFLENAKASIKRLPYTNQNIEECLRFLELAMKEEESDMRRFRQEAEALLRMFGLN